jgi:hypothetical protein
MLLAAGFAGLCLLSQEAAGQAKARKGDAKPVPGLMAKKGGMLRVPASGPVIQVLNAQKRVPAKEVTEVCQAIESAMRLEIRQAPATKATKPMAEAARMVTDPKCAAAIVVCDNPDLPMLLVAPEGKWALVNVAALAVDKPNQEKLTKRLRKEIWRGFGHLMGAAHSHFEACVMKSVRNPADLDALPVETVSPEPYVKIQQHARTIGASPYTMVSYRDACRQGWAPAPTNAIQQAVWDEVKREAAPTAAEKAAAQPK